MTLLINWICCCFAFVSLFGVLVPSNPTGIHHQFFLCENLFGVSFVQVNLGFVCLVMFYGFDPMR